MRLKSMVMLLFGGLWLAVGLLWSGWAWAQERPWAAELIALIGEAEIKPAGGGYRPAHLRDKLRLGDAIRTGEKSRAKLIFQDDSVTVLAEKTTLEITTFHFDAVTKKRRGLLKTLEGKIRFLVQQIPGTPQPDLKVESEVLSVGIRGTDGILETGKQHKVYLLESENPLQITNKSTGQTTDLQVMQFLVTEKKGPLQIFPISPDLLEKLLQEFRLAYDFIPKNLLAPGSAPESMIPGGPEETGIDTQPPVIQPPLPALHFQGSGGKGGGKPLPPGPSPKDERFE